MVLNPRKAKLLEELPKNNWKVKPSAIKAGYSPIYADKQAKQILKSALKDQAKEVQERISANTPIDTKQLKRELISLMGLSSEDLYKRLKWIGFEQDKDLSSAIKILAVLAREAGISLGDEAPKTIVPVLNIGVKQVEAIEAPAPLPDNGSTEP